MKHYKTFDEMIELIEQFPVDGKIFSPPEDSKWEAEDRYSSHYYYEPRIINS